VRRFATITVLATATAAVLVSIGNAGLRTVETTAKPTLYFMYAMNCTLSIVDDSGKPVTSIAPGAYQVDIRTPVPFATLPLGDIAPDSMTACNGIPQFQLTGPGVNFFTTMSAGCVDDLVVPETFQPSATYVATDLNQPSVARASFTTLASGTPTAPVVTYGGGKGTGQVSTDIVGSLAIRSTLEATVSVAGKATLTSGGKAISKLAAGRYKFRVADQDAKAGLKILGPKSTAPIVLTGAAYKGTKTKTIALTPGRWTYYTSLATIRYFSVS